MIELTRHSNLELNLGQTLGRTLGTSVLATLLSLSVADLAVAHQVETNYAIDLFTSDLSMTSTYSTGEPMEDAEVRIYAPDNATEPWLTTQTDAQGQFTFLPDATIVGTWRVEIEREGHMDILDVPVGSTGVEFQNISRQGNRDLHYAAVPWQILAGTGALAGIAATSLWFWRRRTQA